MSHTQPSEMLKSLLPPIQKQPPRAKEEKVEGSPGGGEEGRVSEHEASGSSDSESSVHSEQEHAS